MIYIAIAVLVLGLAVLAARAFVSADVGRLGGFVSSFAVMGLALVAVVAFVVLAASERWPLALLALGVLALLAKPLLGYYRDWRRNAKRTEEVETEFLRVRYDREPEGMTGTVRRGSFAGRRLESLTPAELMTLLRKYRAENEPSARLLEAYLDWLSPEWRGQGGHNETMTREEALEVLGLKPGADPDAIKAAHHRLMRRLDPDHGGSSYLAAKLDRAKQVLLSSRLD